MSFTERIIKSYVNKGLFTLDEDNLYWILNFMNATLRTIKVPKITQDIINNNARFLYKHKLYNIDQFMALVLHSRLKQMVGHRMAYNHLLQHDIVNLFNLQINIEPNTINNKIKLRSRILYVKDSRPVQGTPMPFMAIGDALQGTNKTLTEEELAKAVNEINPDPIGADKPPQGVFSRLGENESYSAPVFQMDKKSFVSIFPVKQNIVERFKAHITSDGLKFDAPEIDPLMNKTSPEVKNILVVFDRIDKDMKLIGGEIPITEEVARTKIRNTRSYVLNGTSYITLPKGSKVVKGNVLAWSFDGKPALVLNINLDNCIVDDVRINHPNGITIKLSYDDYIGSSRIISRTGLKGVTVPVRTLGTVKFDGQYYKVDALAGPNSLKGGFNQIRLAWVAWKLKRSNQSLDLANPDLSPSELKTIIDDLSSDIQPVIWHGPTGTKMVYAGIISIMVTTKVSPTNLDRKTKVMTETLKFLKLYGQDKLIRLLLDEGVDTRDIKLVREMTKIVISDTNNLPTINTESLVPYLYRIDIPDLLRTNRTTKMPMQLLLNPYNKGFVLAMGNTKMIMPSASLINEFTNQIGDNYVYPDFYLYAMRIFFGLYRRHNPEQIEANYNRYLQSITGILLKKRGFITSVTVPKLFGGSFMQIPCKHVPRYHIVPISHEIKRRIKKEIGDRDIDINNLYDISIRNPVLWNAQLKVKKILWVDEFKKLLEEKEISLGQIIIPELSNGVVLRNPLDMMDDQSDSDGDMLSLAIPLKEEAQITLRQLFKIQFPISSYEKEWIKSYTRGEMDNSKLEPVPFSVHEMSRKEFNEILINASISKSNIGQGTINLWRFTTVLELMLHKGHLDKDALPVLLWMYGKVVHDHIVRGIKHSKGNAGYDLFIPDETGVNHQKIISYWTNIGVPGKYARLFAAILQASTSDYITAASRVVNGGSNIRSIAQFLRRTLENNKFSFLLSYQLLERIKKYDSPNQST